MSIRDYAAELSAAQSLISAAGTVNSTNVYDTKIAGGDIGVGEDFAFLFEVNTALAGAGSTVSFQLQTSDDEAFGSGNVTVYQSPAVAVASLVKGYQLFAKAPLGFKRYIRAQYVIVGASGITAGTVTCGPVKDYDATKKHPTAWSF